MKKPISIRLDLEIIEFFKSSYPKGYQTGIAEVLLRHIREAERNTSFLLGRAQEIFHQFHARCFWHLRKDLIVTKKLVPTIIEGLRRHGGRRGYELARELQQLKESP